MSRCKKFKIQSETGNITEVLITARQTENDFNGNPQVLMQVWTLAHNGTGHIWYPKLKGYRDRKDDCYKTQMHGGIDNTLEVFAKQFQNHFLGLN